MKYPDFSGYFFAFKWKIPFKWNFAFGRKNSNRKVNRDCFKTFMKRLFLLTFANLIADGATCLASGLAGGLALAAAAFFQRILQSGLVNGFNVFHLLSAPKNLSCAVDDKISDFFEGTRNRNS